MLDYHGDCVALREFADMLGAATFPDPAIAAAQQEALDATADEPQAALLGAFIHHLIAHAAADGSELELLGRAAGLWERGRGLCDRLGGIRADLEGAMEDPAAPDAPERFNSAAFDAQELANSVALMRGEIDTLRSDVMAFRHLPPHPRQQDLSTDAWDWGNLQLARRTDAFVRALFRQAGDRRTLSFAVGAGAAYGANVAGSAYINHVVGGPRRTHRHRDRLARNTVGSWLAAHHPAALTPSAMADGIRFGEGEEAALPAELETLLTAALSDTFDLALTAPAPDLQLGYTRLIEHLTLLDGFELPATPAQPGQLWMEKLWGDPANPPPTLRPQDVDVVGQDGGGVAVRMGPDEPGSRRSDRSDSAIAGAVCGVLVLAIILIDVIQAFVQCIGQWANGHTCTFWRNMLLSRLWERDPPDPRDPTHTETNEERLTAIASAPQAAELVGVLFEAHAQAWEAMERARGFLALSGLIYPARIAGLPLYEQFAAVPPEDSSPHREEPVPEHTYHLYPGSPIEEPVAAASPYQTAATPQVFLTPGASLHAATVTLGLWGQIAAGEHDTQNRDLDADRGFGHACWAAQGSVHDEPVDVAVLEYDEQ